MSLTPMIRYEVTLQVEPSLAREVEAYMRGEHIPAILRTSCFRRIRLDQASPARFRTTYEADSAAGLERYLGEHATALRGEFQARFPDGVRVTRETWVQRDVWDHQ